MAEENIPDSRTINDFIRDLESSRRYLEHNYKEFNARSEDYFYCGKNNTPPPEKLKTIIENYSHALDNYLASYQALIDHMMRIRNTISKQGNKEIIKIYRKKLSESGLRHEQTFARRLRVYLLHYRIPEIDVGKTGYNLKRNENGGFNVVGVSIMDSLALNKEKLLKWNGWQDGRVYLDNLKRLYKERIPISYWKKETGLISDLHHSVMQFLDWFEELLANMK